MGPKNAASTPGAYLVPVLRDDRHGASPRWSELSLDADAGCLTCATLFPGSMVPPLVTITLRSLTPLDVPAARALAHAVLDTLPRSEPFRVAVDTALGHEGDEHRAIIANTQRGLIGLIVFGETAGAHGAGRISFVAVERDARRRGVGLALIEAACADLRGRGARFVAIELTDDPALQAGHALASRAAFRREGHVDDYVSEGVGLELLRRDLAAAG